MSPNDKPEIIKTSLLYMHQGEDIYDYLKDCEVKIEKVTNVFRVTYFFTFTMPFETFKRFENFYDSFVAKIKLDLYKYHHYSDVVVQLTADWDKLNSNSTLVAAPLTPWVEINKMQEELVSQSRNSVGAAIDFQKTGLIARNLLLMLANIVFDADKHTPKGNNRDLGKGFYKNRLWAFMKYKLSQSTYETLFDYYGKLLECSDKAVDLSNNTTHSLNADSFLAQSCAISVISTVHIVKIVFEMPDP